MNSSGSDKIRAAVLAHSAGATAELCRQVEATGLARVAASELLEDSRERIASRMGAASPQVILVDADQEETAIQALTTLARSCAGAWLLVTSALTDPGFIIKAVRAGAREFLPKPVTSESLAEAFKRFREAGGQVQMTRSAGMLYCVTAAKGGSGATSVAINLAASIAALPKTKVSLVDLSVPIGDAATYLDIHPEYSLLDALAAGRRLDSVLLESFMTETADMGVLAGWTQFDGASLPDADSLKSTLLLLRNNYSHTVVDVSAAIGLVQLRELTELCDALLVVLTPELPALSRTYRLLLSLDGGSNTQKLQVVLNRAERSNEISLQDIEKTLKRSIDWVLPNDYRRSIEAIRRGEPVVRFNHSKLASQYGRLAEKMTGISPKPKRRGLLGLFSND